jgi:putative transposase
MLRSHKIRLVPNQAQEVCFAKGCGTARFAWNWALAEWNRQYDAHKADPAQPRPSEGALRRQLNAIKHEQFPWMAEVTKCAVQESIIALGAAFKNWFDSMSGKRAGPRMGRPDFKKKGRCRDAFKIHGNVIAVDGCRIRIPLLGWVRMREPVRFAGFIKSCTISRVAGAWHASLTVETEDVPQRTENQGAVGVDLGIAHLAVTSAGDKVPGPKALAVLLARLRRLSRAHSRKVKGSANRRKSAQALARLHWRIGNVRGDALHKLSHQLTTDNTWIALEDLNVKGMLENDKLARHIADAGWGELRRQLVYKAQQRGVTLSVVDRFFPSSKTCSECDAVNEKLTLADRRWTCVCGAEHDRDVNAARNLLKRSIADAVLKAIAASDQHTAGGGPVAACGEEGSGRRRKTAVKPASAKQEVNHKLAVAPGYE